MTRRPGRPWRARLPLLLVALGGAAGARTSLHKAARDGDLPPLKVAIEGRFDEYEGVRKVPDLNAQDKKGNVPLHLAVCNSRRELEAVKVLLEKGADANALDGDGVPALHIVARRCDHKGEHDRENRPSTVATAKLLIKHKADVNAVHSSAAPLHLAAADGNVKLVELLLSKGADANVRDADQATPLHSAVRGGQARAVLALLRGGADPQLKDAKGEVARDAATGRDSASASIRAHLDDATQIRASAVEEKRQKAVEKAAAKAKAAEGKGEL